MIKRHIPIPGRKLDVGEWVEVFNSSVVLDVARAAFNSNRGHLRVIVNGGLECDDSPGYDYYLGYVFPNGTWFVPVYDAPCNGGKIYAVSYQPHNTSSATVEVHIYNPSPVPIQLLDGVIEYWE